MEMARFAEPVDKFVMADWQGAEIYEGETYLEMHNGDIVLDDMETIVEWAREHATAKVAERG